MSHTSSGDKKKLKNEELKESLLNSYVGLVNAGGSCYMASIIQILIHLKKFLDVFLDKYSNNKLSKILYNFLKMIAETNYEDVEIKYLADQYYEINKKFNGEEGNNPMTFFTEFIKELSKDNEDIKNLFMGEKLVKFKDSEDDYEEKFLFYLVFLDKYNEDITTYINKKTCNDEKDGKKKDNPILEEKIVKTPNILIINLEIENIKYEGEKEIIVQNDRYKLLAVNKYTDCHSIS